MAEDAINSIIDRMISHILPEIEIELLLKIERYLHHLRTKLSAMEAILRGAGKRSATSNFTARHKKLEDEEQSVTDYSFQRRLKVKKNLEIMPIDSSRTAFPEVRRSRMKMMEKILETDPFEKMRYGIAECERHCWLDGLFHAEINKSYECKKRNRKFVYDFDDILRQERKGIKKQRQLPYPEESLTDCALKNFIKAVQEMDRTKRRTNKNGKITNWRCKWQRMVEMLLSMKTKYALKATNIGKTKASQQSDLLVIIQVIQETDRKCRVLEAEAKWPLLLIGETIEKLDRQRSEDLKEKARQLSYAKIFFPPPCKVKVTATDDKTREGVQSEFRDLENQLYDKGNYQVGCKDFPGLEQELKKTSWGKIPDYLESIAIQIEKDRGKTTDIFHIPIQVLLCAAIKEMKDFSVGDLDLGTLKKWSATLNYAKKYGFQVGFADNLLKKNLLAYFAIQNLPKSTVKI